MATPEFWFDSVVEQQLHTVDVDPTVQQLAHSKPDLLARLLALRGVSELSGEDLLIARKAGHALFLALQHLPDESDEILTWLTPGTHPPLADDFTPGELWWLDDYRRVSPFISLAVENLPGGTGGLNPDRPVYREVIVETGDYL